ncbi:MAG: nucleotide sugar dehydrogenase [Anaerolineae bacterium]
MNVSVFGLGYVGCVTAAALASQGCSVVGVDVNPDKVRMVNQGRSPVVEPGLDALVSGVVANGSLTATEDHDRAVKGADLCLVCVATPSQNGGGLDMRYLDHVFGQIGRAMAATDGYRVVTLRSTALPGTLMGRLVPTLERESGKVAGTDFGVATNPEFLREGSAIADFRHPPFTIIGQGDERAGDVLAVLYADIEAPMIRTDPDTASMVKYACNAFHALKVTFANEVGCLSKEMGLDGTEVMDIVCQDTMLNISPRYLKPGFAFGGSCLPKDLRAMLHRARHSDLSLPLLESILPSNSTHLQRAIDMVLREGRRQIGVVGLSFKPDTDDLRESPVVELVEVLSGKGLDVRIWDENVNLARITGRNKAFIETAVPHISALMRDSLEEVVKDAGVVVVSHKLAASGEQLRSMLRPDQVVVDLVKVFGTEDGCPASCRGICW